ncbi:MAG: hypothetical protein KJ629_05310 [Candidatus Omnitrophica bacterium]|nr:hypothetical protein [Candidatus Omnitrophota bacterium]
MKKIILFLIVCLTLTGCVVTKWNFHKKIFGRSGFTFQTKKRHKVKPKDFKIPIHPNNPYEKGTYAVIGEFHYIVEHRQYKVIDSLKEKAAKTAKKVGADAVINWNIGVEEKSGIRYYPSYTTYEPITTYHTGKAQANAYGTGGYASGTGTYSGQDTTYIPQYHEARSVPYYKKMLHFKSKAIVFCEGGKCEDITDEDDGPGYEWMP